MNRYNLPRREAGVPGAGLRRVLSVSLVLSLLALQAAAGALPVGATGGGTSTPIKHVVTVMMENHSFDNIFGLYPTMNSSDPGPLASSLQAPEDVLGAPPAMARALSQVPNGTYSTVDPNEGVYRQDFNGGKMNGFAAYGSQSMTYFGPAQLAVEWDWAEEYAVAGSYFSSCLCKTDPNRLYSLAGYGAGLTGDSGPPPYIPASQSIFAELASHGVSWGYYVLNPSAGDFPLGYFSGFGAYSSQVRSWSAFDAALAGGTLPSVSWVMPVGGGAGSGVYDQHPSGNVTAGEGWLLGVVDRVMASPHWNSTAIFVTYDEGGGYYDQVPPPVVDGVQLGFRVPMFVISPYAKENYVSDTVMNHASLLAFVDYNWRLPALNPFVAASGLPLDMFDFNQSYPGGGVLRAPVVLQNGSSYPAPLQIPLAALPYQREGSYGGTLASLGAPDYVGSNSTVTPFYETLLFAGAALAAAALVLALGYLRAFRGRRGPARGAPSGTPPPRRARGRGTRLIPAARGRAHLGTLQQGPLRQGGQVA